MNGAADVRVTHNPYRGEHRRHVQKVSKSVKKITLKNGSKRGNTI